MDINDDMLIQLVQQNAVLYNKFSDGYEIPQEKHKAWARISTAAGTSIDACMRRWNFLRGKFIREQNKLKLISENCAQNVDAVTFLNTMRFLEPFITTRALWSPTKHSVASPQEEAVEELQSEEEDVPDNCWSPVSSLITPSSSSPPTSSKRIRRKRKYEDKLICDKARSFQFFFDSQNAHTENAAIISFGEMITHTVINLNCPIKQARAMRRLANVAMNIQMEAASSSQAQQCKKPKLPTKSGSISPELEERQVV